jgi:branched-chain amino acid transport system permease protein
VILAFPDGLVGAIGKLTRAVQTPRPRPATRLRPIAASTAVERGSEIAIEVRALSKHFGSLSVLDDVQFTARRGELLSLVGPNGAGKTTLIRCLSDGRERSAGFVAIAGHPIDRLPPDRIVQFGLGRKFQAASFFETLTAAECLRVARTHRARPSLISTSAVLELPAAAISVVERSGLADRLGEEARKLSHGLKQALELAMVLSLEPDVLLLDEPTAGLTRAERRDFADILTSLASQARLCILLVEHDLDFVREISSRIIVLHQGRIALDGSVNEVANSALVREIYTGEQSAAAEVGP